MTSSHDRRRVLRRTALVAAMLCIVSLLAWRGGLFSLGDRERLAAAIDHVRDVPHLAPLFVGLYAIAAAVGVPATPLTLAGGALFGAYLGVALNWTGELLAALLAFGTVRATGIVVRRDSASTGTAAYSLISANGGWMLFRLRLVPVVPFALLNAAAGLSGMRWGEFALATALGIIPITIIYTVSASELIAGVEGSGARAVTTAMVSAMILIVVSFVPALLRRSARGSS
jgi:uncharacterized membrane protein YdjX (TVP38/TMEM64 family)